MLIFTKLLELFEYDLSPDLRIKKVCVCGGGGGGGRYGVNLVVLIKKIHPLFKIK